MRLPPYVREWSINFISSPVLTSARPLLFSGDAISYVSNRRAQSTLNDLKLIGDVSLLYGELALPMPGWPASAA
jgi:hypothetical protein